MKTEKTLYNVCLNFSGKAYATMQKDLQRLNLKVSMTSIDLAP